jgi:hypothetical protein
MADPISPDDFRPPGKKPADNVGSAYMEADGTLEMRPRTETDDGTIGEAYLVIPPGDSRYAAMVKHLDRIKPGEGRSIKPFPATRA